MSTDVALNQIFETNRFLQGELDRTSGFDEEAGLLSGYVTGGAAIHSVIQFAMSNPNGGGTDPSPKAQEVMDYLATHELTQRLNDIVNNTIRARAEDPFAYMAQQFLAIAQPPTISHVTISTILDQTGTFRSLQADVYSWQPSSFVHMGRGVWPSPAQCDNIADLCTLVTSQLKSKPLKSESLSELDKTLSDLKDPNASVAVPALSLSIARAVAHATRQELYLFLSKRSNPEKPPNVVVSLPLVDIVKSTKVSFGYFGVFPSRKEFPLRQFYLAVGEIHKLLQAKLNAKDNVDVDKAETLLSLLEDGIKASQVTPGDEISLWFDAGAGSMYNSETGEYDIGGGATVTREELLAQYQTMSTQHRSLALIVDPFHRSDTQGWERFVQAMENRCVAVSSGEAINGSLSSISFGSTVSDYLKVAGALRSTQKDFVVVQANSSQNDDAVADLTVAVSSKYCRFGPMGQGYNSNFYNRLMQIEESIKSQK